MHEQSCTSVDSSRSLGSRGRSERSKARFSWGYRVLPSVTWYPGFTGFYRVLPWFYGGNPGFYGYHYVLTFVRGRTCASFAHTTPYCTPSLYWSIALHRTGAMAFLLKRKDKGLEKSLSSASSFSNLVGLSHHKTPAENVAHAREALNSLNATGSEKVRLCSYPR
eukprot:1177876-Prorocentrum_minimum.AAC.4